MLKRLYRKLQHLALGLAPICPEPYLRMWLYRRGGIPMGAGTYVNVYVTMLVDLDLDVRVRIGERVAVAPGTVLVSNSGPNVSRLIQFYPFKKASIVIEDDVWIGANAVVLPGVTIGRMAVVGAGAVVTANVAPGAVVAGVPAREIKRLPLDGVMQESKAS
jgi:acetyltransferase-like isoleucine patch superfamily enzyme